MEKQDFARVSVAIDLSRACKDAIVETVLRHIIMVGKEADLLENVRRSERHEHVSKELIRIQSLSLRIDPNLFDAMCLRFAEDKLMHFDDEQVVLNYSIPSEVYAYGNARLSRSLSEGESRLLSIIVRATSKPIPEEDLDLAIESTTTRFRAIIKEFLMSSKILVPVDIRRQKMVVSPRLYKDEHKFKTAVEVLGEHGYDNVVEFLQENPGNPAPVVQQHLNAVPSLIPYLSEIGLVDPLRLNVKGDTKEYLYTANTVNSRADKDHTDLVKKTLANFRYGEYYSTKTRLYDLDKFLTRMIERGYGGYAEAIGTDYRELEGTVFKVKKVLGRSYRFWMLKRDVVEDCLSILRGIIPIHSDKTAVSLSHIDNVIQTRLQQPELSLTHRKQVEDAIRDIQEGMGS